MKQEKKIFLVGMMGAGKTTIGKLLAQRLNLNFVDSDHEIELRTGATIPLIFEIEGEESFRKREEEVIDDLTKQSNIVLATGGGVVVRAINRQRLKERGFVIYLRATADNIVQRTMHDFNRPLLQVDNKKEKIEQLIRERESFYQEVADLILDTANQTSHAMAQLVIKHINKKEPKNNNNAQKKMKNTTRGKEQPKHARQRLKVELGKRSYPIEIGEGLLTNATLMDRLISGKKCAIITNDVVAPLYLETVTNTLLEAKKEVITLVLPDGEKEKNWASLMKIFDFLLQNRCDRKTTLVALGGGVIGDMTGYAAASFMRGVPFVQMATTLLAEVDSSVGGKTGINHPLGKNMIGAFYQPEAVIADIQTLATLPDKELSAGLAEVIKYGAIINQGFFAWLEANMSLLLARDARALAYAIRVSCQIKASVVKQDERESKGIREILNFGHTFAHAIEAGLGYGTWLHGEAVGCGMVMATDLSYRLGMVDEETKNRVKALVEKAKLPIKAPPLEPQTWINLMRVDKKNVGGEIKFVLLQSLGTTQLRTVPEETLIQTIQAAI